MCDLASINSLVSSTPHWLATYPVKKKSEEKERKLSNEQYIVFEEEKSSNEKYSSPR